MCLTKFASWVKENFLNIKNEFSDDTDFLKIDDYSFLAMKAKEDKEIIEQYLRSLEVEIKKF